MLTIVLSVAVFAQTTVYVDGTNGDDTFNSGSLGFPYRSVTKAITVLTAGSGGTINIMAAVYQNSTTGETDPITVNATGKTITFVGTNVGLNTTVAFTNGFVLTAGTVNMGLTGTAAFNLGSTWTLTAGTMNIATANVILNSGATITFNNGVLNAPPTTGANTNVLFNGSSAIASTSAFLPNSLGSGTLTLSKTSSSAITIDNTSLACGPIGATTTGPVTFSGNVASGTITVSANTAVTFNGNVTVGSATAGSACDIINNSTGTITIGATAANTLTMYSTVAVATDGTDANVGEIKNTSTGNIVVNSTVTENIKNTGTSTDGGDQTAQTITLFPINNTGNTPGAITINGNVSFVNTNVVGSVPANNGVAHIVTLSNTGTGTVAINGSILTPASTAAFTTPPWINVKLSNIGGGTFTTRAAALRGIAGTPGITNGTSVGPVAGVTMTLGQPGDAFTTSWDIVNDVSTSVMTLNGTGALGGALTNGATSASKVVLGANEAIAGVVNNAGNIQIGSNTLTLSGTGAGVLVGAGDIYSITTATTGSGVVKFTGAAPTSTYTGKLPNVEVASATSFSLAGQAVWGNFLISGAGAVTIAGTTDIKGTLNMNGAGTLTINGGTTVRGDINMNAGNITMGTAGLTVVGTFNMPQGTFTFGAQTLTLQGNFNRTGGTIDKTAAGTGTLAFAGSGPQTFSPGTDECL